MGLSTAAEPIRSGRSTARRWDVPLFCLSRIVTDSSPCYARGLEPRHVEAFSSSPHNRAEGRPAVEKRAWGALTGRWVPHDTRDEVVDFVRGWSTKTEVAADRLVGWLGVARGKFFDWKKRYGKANEHNALVPRDHWIDEHERRAIVDYFDLGVINLETEFEDDERKCF